MEVCAPGERVDSAAATLAWRSASFPTGSLGQAGRKDAGKRVAGADGVSRHNGVGGHRLHFVSAEPQSRSGALRHDEMAHALDLKQ